MMKKMLLGIPVLLLSIGLLLVSCAGRNVAAPTQGNFKDPVITLQSFEVPQYDGYWYYASAVKPTQGDPGDRGAPLPLSFIFEVHNPNPYPILLEGIRYTVAFDQDFEVVTFNNNDSVWIPANKTTQLRTTTMITVRSALLSLMVTGGFKLKELGITPFDALEKWWKGVPDYTVPVAVKDGTFSFVAGGVDKVVPFNGTVS
jgi:hypothetical protein